MLPLPPSANRLWRHGRGRIYKSDAYSGWLTQCGWHIAIARPKKITGPYALTVRAARPNGRSPDLDHILKPIGDLLQRQGVISNDNLCEEISAKWASEGMTVRIEEI